MPYLYTIVQQQNIMSFAQQTYRFKLIVIKLNKVYKNVTMLFLIRYIDVILMLSVARMKLNDDDYYGLQFW